MSARDVVARKAEHAQRRVVVCTSTPAMARSNVSQKGVKSDKVKDVCRPEQGIGPEVFRERSVTEHESGQTEQFLAHSLCHLILLRSIGDGKLMLYAVACSERFKGG